MDTYRFGKIDRQEGPLTAEDARLVLADARSRKGPLQALRVDEILDVLDAVASAWASPAYPPRVEALARLPGLVGFSAPMVEQGVLTMVGILRRENLEKRMECDLGRPEYLDGLVPHRRFGGYYMAQPLGIVAHVSAGNVFVGGVDTLIQGILTKNVNLMKMSSVDPVFPVLFARSVMDHDAGGAIAGSMALLAWRGGDAEVERVLKQECDAIVVYGGAETVHSYRQDLGLHTKLIEYGPKYSLVMVAEDELGRRGLAEVTRPIARDIVMWEQSACSSPHVIYVEETPGTSTAAEFVAALAEALKGWAIELPPGSLDPDEATEITRVREVAKVEEAMGKSVLLAPHGTEWTVVLQRDPSFQTSCLNRTIFVKPVARLEEALGALETMGSYLQTVSILAGWTRTRALTEALARIGADRMVEVGAMAVRRHGTPHDGGRGLAELVRWVSLGMEGPSCVRARAGSGKARVPADDGFDDLEDAERDALTLRRLRGLVAYAAAKAPFYAERFKGLEIRELADVRNLPVLTGDDLKKYLPPYGSGLLTEEGADGWVFASGGTTGQPKVVYRTHEEQRYNTERLGKGLRLAAFDAGDVVANLLYAGHMWASFVSYNMALEAAGCRILPIAGNLDLEEIVGYLKMFRPVGAIAVPSFLLALGEYVEQKKVEGVRIRKITTGGEHLFKESREYLGRVLGVEVFASLGYTSNDTGAVGYPCARCAGGLHHVHEDLHLVEIVDPETMEPAPEGRPGKILLTNLHRRLMPTIRYDIGDEGRWVPGRCDCGRKTRMMELMGRSDDMLRVGGGPVSPESVAGAVNSVPGLSGHLQMVVRVSGHLDQLLVRAERKPGAEVDAAEASTAVRAKLYELSKELKAWREKGLIAETAVEILPSGALPRNPRTGKIRLTVDERH